MGTSAPTAENVTDLLQNLKVDSQSVIRDPLEVPSNPIPSTQDAALEVSVAGVGEASNNPVAYETGVDMYYSVNGFATPHGYYYGAYDYPLGDWDEYSRQAGSEGVNAQNSGVYNENGPVMYHPAGYAYGQHLYGPYSSGAPIPRADGQLYGAQGYSYTGHMYQQSVPGNAPYIPSTAAEVPTRAGEPSGDRSANTAASLNAGPLAARPGYLAHSTGSYGRGILPVNLPTSGSQDARVNYEGGRAGAFWSESSKVADVQQRHGLLPVSVSGQSVRPIPPLLPHFPSSQQHRPRFGVAPTPGALSRAFQHPSRMYSATPASGRVPGLGATGWESRGNARNWYILEKGKSRGRGNGLMSNGNSSLDILNEQNRGPRTTRSRNQRLAPGAVRYIQGQMVANTASEPTHMLLNKDQYNRPDFVVKYDNAKFFIIKSYSEDDIHKSIKYSVWASTANGNKKLDAAYQEVKASSGYCPIFLFFSVNASGQFCGVAEMLGPVDFNKNLDFWQQDKWTGRFPVKWHIIKDVPNSQFRHIILENNDNKPVTNSRDTQEVRLEQGLEMLAIFKNFTVKTSILDDFQFYESRQKLMQEKRARQQVQLQHQQIIQRVNKEAEQASPQDHAQTTSQHTLESGRLVEAIRPKEKLLKPKDAQQSSAASEKHESSLGNDVHVSKILSRSESQESSGAAESDKTSPKDAISASCEKQ